MNENSNSKTGKVSNGKFQKISRMWNKIKKFIAPLGAILLALFAYLGGRNSNRHTVAKLQKLNKQLLRDTELLRRNNLQLERSLQGRRENIEERLRDAAKRSTTALTLQRKNRELRARIEQAKQLIEEVENS